METRAEYAASTQAAIGAFAPLLRPIAFAASEDQRANRIRTKLRAFYERVVSGILAKPVQTRVEAHPAMEDIASFYCTPEKLECARRFAAQSSDDAKIVQRIDGISFPFNRK